MKTQPAKAAARCPAPSRQPPLRRTCLALLIGACFGPALAQPTLPQVVNGQATFARQGNVFSITNTPNAIINWQSFSVNPGELTRFIQQSAGSSVLNRITGQDPSRILGALQSNGRVFLVNPNGVLFGRDARVDVNGLVASSLAISNGDFLAGRQRFAADGGAAGAVANQGVITTPAGGQVFLLAPQVDNSGIINAPNGEVVLAAGRSVQLADAANPALQVGLSAPADQAVNLGQVIAQGGRIGIFGALVNQRGRLSADSAVLGENGKIVLKSSGTTLLEAGSRTSATGAGRGGRIELLGRRVGLTGDAGVDASGALGGGSILVGGDYRGANAAVMNAEQSYLGAGATLKADATARGDGGKVVVWSDGATRVLGNISARGGAHGGDGGFVETSGHYLDMQGNVDTTAARGRTGQLLLDPSNIYVAVDGATATGAGMAPTGAGNASNSGNVFSETSSSADSLLTTGALVELLNGSNVTVTTSNPNAGGAGFIKVVSPVAWGSGRALTLDAAAGISLDAGIDGGSGALTLLSAAGDITQSVALKVGALTARAPGGSVMLNFADNQIGGPVTLDASLNAVLAAGGGGALDIASASVGGDLSVIAGGGPLRVSGNVTSNGGIVRLFADNIDLLGSIAVGTGSVTLQPISPTQQIHVGVGAADAAGTLGLSEAELRRISTSGFLTVAPSGADVTGNLTVVGNLDLSSTLNAGSVNGNLLLGVNEGMGNLTINAGAQVVVPGKLELSTQTFDGYTITNAGSLKATEVHLSSGKMVLEGGVIDAPVVSLSTQNAIDLGSSTDSQLATLELSGAELARLNNNTDLRIEVFLNSSGGMVISAPLRLPANLTLAAPAVIDARAALSVGGVFRLDQGSWMQNNANLPAFSAGDFQINQGAASFLRVKGGTGASGGGSPYQIADVYGLQGIASLDMANEYVLAANIAAAGTVNWNGGEGFAPIVDGQGLGFSGVLDGAGHSISGLTINLPAGRGGNGSSVGMFGVLSGGTVKNLSLLGGSVKGVSKVGALAGYVNSGSILNVSSDVSVSGDLTIGGLVGSNNGSIVGSRASGAVTGNGESIGGLVGYNDGSGTISASAAFGGVGGARRVGGLVGLNAGLIQDAFALGAVSGVANPDYMSENIGGLVGENATGGSGSGSIVNVYSAGAVRAAGFANVGGLVGLNNVSLSNGYWNTSTSGQAVGLGADNSSGSSATGLTEAQSMQQASFAGFEFGGSAPVWRLYEGR
ncbi:filamentous hemagglutinin family protein, partial [Janthinobacterium sp. CG_23.3]|uniref:two-partner secretion domain-containing protein n=1 Tax=Janthinobacterium sp. CG_23.3 TaxID=3349634 RepID=UPI0038D4A40D